MSSLLITENIITNSSLQGMFLSYLDGGTVEYNTVSSNDRGIYLLNSDNTIIQYNLVEDSTDSGVFLANADSDNNTIRYNYFDGNNVSSSSDGSIKISGSGTGNEVYGNILIDGYRSLFITATPNGLLFYNNTIYNSRSYTSMVRTSTANFDFRNNIFYSDAGLVNMYADMTGTASSGGSYNLYYNGDSGDEWRWGGDWATWAEWQAFGNDAGTGSNTDPSFESGTQLWVTSGSFAEDGGQEIDGHNDRVEITSTWGADGEVTLVDQGTVIGAYEFPTGGGEAGSIIKWENVLWEDTCWGNCL
jgi:parallel beta-helix repeat protein